MSRSRRRARWHCATGSWWLIAVVTSLSLACASQKESDGDPGAAPLDVRIFRLAGVDDHVLALSEALVLAAEAHAAELDPEVDDRLVDRARMAADPTRLLPAAEALFAARSGDGLLLESAHDFLVSDTGRRMRALEEQADSVLDDEAFSDFVDGLFAAPVPIERVGLLERLGMATRGAQIAADTEAIAARVIVRARHRDGVGPGSAPALAAVLAAIDRRSNQTAERLRVQSTVWLQYVYRDASDDDLAAYVAFAESPTGIWLVDSTWWTLRELEPWLDERMTAHPDAPAGQ
jgi:hypothetical protein